MDREEILAKARRENQNRDMCEKEAIVRASSIATKVGMLLCCLIAVLEVVLTGHISYSSWAIYFGILCTMFFVKYRILRRRHELLVAILYLALGLAFLVLYVCRLAG